MDPDTARFHALTAAHVAVDRANERASTEMKRSAELSRNQSSASRIGTEATPRSQNIRFGDMIDPHRYRSALQSKASSAASSVYMPGSTSYSHLSKVGNGPPLNEFGVAEGYGSAPSSYRRLRKTKSMLTPRKHGPSTQDLSSYSPGTPRTLRNVKSSIGDHNRAFRLGLKRSMSFLKVSSGNLSRTFRRSHSVSEQHDAAVGRAREQFEHDVDNHQLHKKTSFLSTPKSGNQKPFRKTVRSNRTTEYGEGVKSEYQQPKQESKFRSFSASLRDKFRRVLRRSSSKDNNLPAQQLDASRAHFRDYLDGTNSNMSHGEYLADNQRSASRGSLYVPSSHKEESMEDLEAISRSLRSMHSSDSLRSNGRSRITSWTNSTINNSLPGRGTAMERKRLSIIQEHGGPHQPSSSIGRHMDEISATHLPLSARHGNEPAASPIDSQRVYSALMKRIDQEQATQDRAKTQKSGPLHDSRQHYNSSAQSFQTAPTIRQVVSEESIRTMAPDDQHRQFSLHAPSWHETGGRTPQQIALENETVEKRKCRLAQEEAQSSFFPFSSENKPRTPSPFKMALASRHEQQTSSGEDDGSVIINRPSGADSGVENSSESQYSRTTSGQLPMPGMNKSELELADEPAGMATIVPTRINRYPRPAPSLAQVHKTKSNASVEWKSWMNSQMISLDRRNSRSSNSHYREEAQIDGEDIAVGGRRRSPSGGLGRRPSSRTAHNKGKSENPTHSRQSSTMNERFPLLELKEVPRNNTPKPRQSSSATRLAGATTAAAEVKRATLMAVGGILHDENSRIPQVGTGKSHPLRPRYSQLSFQTVEEPVSTPGRLQHHDHDHRLHQYYPKQQHTAKRLGRPQSSITIRSQYGRITEASGDDEVEDEIPSQDQMANSRLSCPFVDDGYGGGGGGMGGIRRISPTHPSRYVGHEDDDHYEIGDDTALPRVALPLEKAPRKNNDKAGMGIALRKGMPIGIGSKRMVSNFLRSRRRNQNRNVSNSREAGGEGAAGAEAEESPAFV